MQRYAIDQPHGFSNRISRVAIVGAGGSVGRYLAEALLETGKHVLTAITRPGSTNILPQGMHVARVDYDGDNEAALVEAMQGQQVLIITMAVRAPRGTVTKLIRAASKAGVPYVLPNWFGHDNANNSLCDDSMLSPSRDSIFAEMASHRNTSYIFLVCNFWYEFSLGGGPDRFGFNFKTRSFIKFDDGNVPLNTSTWPQCGRAVANLLSLKEIPDNEADHSPTLSQFANSAVYISSFRVNQLDMFESIKRVTATTDVDWTITNESAEQRWKEAHAAVQQGNFREFPRQLYSRMFFPTADGDYQSNRDLHNKLLGLPVEDLDEYTEIAIRMAMNDEVVGHH